MSAGPVPKNSGSLAYRGSVAYIIDSRAKRSPRPSRGGEEERRRKEEGAGKVEKTEPHTRGEEKSEILEPGGEK